ncbi:MAG: hypothetical protein AB7T37_08975 [Dehalococcoidia bacterium]
MTCPDAEDLVALNLTAGGLVFAAYTFLVGSVVTSHTNRSSNDLRKAISAVKVLAAVSTLGLIGGTVGLLGSVAKCVPLCWASLCLGLLTIAGTGISVWFVWRTIPDGAKPSAND